MTNIPLSFGSSSELQIPRPRVIALLGGPIALVIAPVALGLALQVNYGSYDPIAVRWLTVALLACFISYRRLKSHDVSQSAGTDEPALRMALAIGLAIQFWSLLTTSPMATLVVYSGRDLLPFRAGLIVAMASISLALMPSAAASVRRQQLALIGILSAYFFIGLWVLRVMPPPPVDVCLFQREACRALLHGQNPYAMTFAIPFDHPEKIYGAGTFANGRLLFGYPYPPLSLVLVLPGYLLGDFRLSHLAAMTLAGALIALARPGRIGTAAAALLLFTPRAFFFIEAGWTEPLAILMLAGTVFAIRRNSRLSPLWLGLLLATKQYLILAAPIAWAFQKIKGTGIEKAFGHALFRRFPVSWASRPCVVGKASQQAVFLDFSTPGTRHGRDGRDTGRITTEHSGPLHFIHYALALAALISLPMVAWNLPAFVHSAVLLQFHQPMRMDALSYVPWLDLHAGIHLPIWVAFLATAAAIVIVVRQRSKSPAAFPAGVALVFFVFFALNKQAFCNYYMFVIAAMSCAVAAWADTHDGIRNNHSMN